MKQAPKSSYSLSDLPAETSDIWSATPLPLSFIKNHQIHNPFNSSHYSSNCSREESKGIFGPHLANDNSGFLHTADSPLLTSQALEPEILLPKHHPSSKKVIISQSEPQIIECQLQPQANTDQDFVLELTEELANGFEDLPLYCIPIDESELIPKAVIHLPITTKKTLVLDLDETLVHALPITGVTKEEKQRLLAELAKRKLTAKIISVLEDIGTPQHCKLTFMVIIRPFARELLKAMSLYYDIIIFTASKRPYAEKVVAELDPEKEFISCVLSREHCIKRYEHYEKDPRILLGRNLKDVVIVDNQIQSFSLHMNNGIFVQTFMADGEDIELKRLIEYLRKVSTKDDVREEIKQSSGIIKLYKKYLGKKTPIVCL